MLAGWSFHGDGPRWRVRDINNLIIASRTPVISPATVSSGAGSPSPTQPERHFYEFVDDATEMPAASGEPQDQGSAGENENANGRFHVAGMGPHGPRSAMAAASGSPASTASTLNGSSDAMTDDLSFLPLVGELGLDPDQLAELVWAPSRDTSEDTLQSFLSQAETDVAHQYGHNEALALRTLRECGYQIKEALARLAWVPRERLDWRAGDSEWAVEEIAQFEQAFSTHDKQFNIIAKMVSKLNLRIETLSLTTN